MRATQRLLICSDQFGVCHLARLRCGIVHPKNLCSMEKILIPESVYRYDQIYQNGHVFEYMIMCAPCLSTTEEAVPFTDDSTS